MVNSRTYRCDSNNEIKKQKKRPLQMLNGLLNWKEGILISNKKT